VYRLGGPLALDDLSGDERLAFGAVLRLVAVLDAQSDEREALAAMAAELGEEAFWDALDRAEHEVEGPDHARQLAEAVERQEARELIYACASQLAFAGAFSSDAASVLGSLREMWSIAERVLVDR
jgi:hypothetical protein